MANKQLIPDAEHGIFPTIVTIIIVADEQTYKDVAKLAVPGSYVFENKRKCFAENAEVVGLDFDLI
jgi:hypothetical protein